MKVIGFVAVSAVLFLSACSGNSGAGDTSDADRQRWPGQTSYSTKLEFNGCVDTYEYNNQADYCVALTDEEKSKCNTRAARKSAYEFDCGNDFSPRNILGTSMSGYDSYLQ